MNPADKPKVRVIRRVASATATPTAASATEAQGDEVSTPTPTGRFHFFSPVPRGLEEVLVAELQHIGAHDVEAVPGGVHFTGNKETSYRVNLYSRFATRVLQRVAQGPYRTEDDIYHLARTVNWTQRFLVKRTIRIYVTAIRAPLRSLEFITLKVKDAVADVFREALGERPSVDTANPDVRIHLFLTADQATLYLDTSGEALWLRGQKIAKVEAPLKENLAAGILKLIEWEPGIPLLDPMCGSGTFLMEAAQMSIGEAPGLSREEDFGFQRMAGFDANLWRTLQEEAAAGRENPDKLPIWGGDIDKTIVERAHQNLSYAGVDDLVEVKRADILECKAPAPAGIMVANLPYGERLGEADELAELYPKLGDALKRNFAGWTCWLLTADTRLPKLIGLKASRKIPLYNGPLDCRLYRFEIVAGSARNK